MNLSKSSSNHFAFWVPGPQWQQKWFEVLQLLYQLRMSPIPCLTKVLKFTRTAHMTPNTLPLARSEPICCTAHALTSCWQCNCRVGVPVVYLGKLQRPIFFDVCREMFRCRVLSLHLDFIFAAIERASRICTATLRKLPGQRPYQIK